MESAGQAAARMAVNGGHVLVAAGAWTGLDIPMWWRHVVMPKAPYGPPTILNEHQVSLYVVRCINNSCLCIFYKGYSLF